MATTEEKVLITFEADASKLKATLTDSNKLLKEQGDSVDKNGKKISNIGNAFEKTGTQISKATITSSKGMEALTVQTQKLEKELIDTAKATDTIAAKAQTLKAQYKAAMIDVQNGVEGAAEKAGQLKDQIDDANESVKNLASGSKLEQFSNTLGSVGGKLAALDFEGAAEQAKLLGDIANKMSLKETLGQVKNLGSTLLSTATSLINPFTLVVASIAGIAYGIYSVITAEDKEITKLKELSAIQQTRFDLEANGIDNEIKNLKALGQNTEALERKKLFLAIENQKTKVKLAKAQYALERESAVNALALIMDRAQAEKAIANKEQTGENDKFKALRAAELELNNLQGDLSSQRLGKLSDIATKAITVVADEENKILDKRKEGAANYDKLLQKKKEDAVRWAKIEADEKAYAEIAPAIKVNKELELTEEERRKIIMDSNDQIQAAIIIDYDENIKRIHDSIGYDQSAYEERLRLLNNYLEQGLITQEQFNEEADKAREDQIEKDAQAFLKKTEFAQGAANAALSINDSVNTIMQNRLKEGQQLSISQQEAAFNREKALGVLSVGISTAQGIAKAVAASPLTFGLPFSGFVALTGGLQIAAILSKQFKPQGFAEGTPLVKGGVKGKDSVHALLMPDERVVTAEDNKRHWNALEAIRTGTFNSDYVRMDDIRHANGLIRDADNESFAGNIASSLMLNKKGWSGENLARELRGMDNNENKRHKQLINVLSKSKPTFRKK